jgi:hypothetical protein
MKYFNIEEQLKIMLVVANVIINAFWRVRWFATEVSIYITNGFNNKSSSYHK